MGRVDAFAERLDRGVMLRILLGRTDAGARVSWWFGPWLVVCAGAAYGAVMGSWDLSSAARWWYVLFAAVKVPMVVLFTTAVCLPGMFVLSTVAGLRRDFADAMGAILAGQAGTAVSLAAMAPVTGFVYVNGVSHSWAVLWSAVVFAIATLTGYAVMLRRYRGLIARDRRHRVLLAVWVVLYVFVGIQMGWMLRPFVGSPGLEVAFVRPGAVTNAYVAVAGIVRQAWEQWK